jgi:hypothetical protein
MPKGKAFKGFSDTQMKRIAEKLGYKGPISGFKKFLQSNTAMANKFTGLEEKARMKFAVGGMTTGNDSSTKAVSNFVNDQNDFITNAANNNTVVQPASTGNRTATAEQMQAFNASNQQQLGGGQRGNLANTGFEQDIGITDGPRITPMPIVPSPPPGQEQPQAQGQGQGRVFTDYQQKAMQYQENLVNNAPENIKNAKTQAEEIQKQLNEKYEARGQQLSDYFNQNYAERARNAITAEQQEALNKEMANDTAFQEMQKAVKMDYESDPLYAEMQRLGQTYNDYISQGLQQYTQDNPPPSMADVALGRLDQPAVPVGGTMQPAMTATDESQFIDPATGQVTPPVTTVGTGTVDTATADMPATFATETVDAAKSEEEVRKETEALQAATGQVSQEAQVTAAEMDPTSTQVGTVPAAQIKEATKVEKPASRTLQSGEMVDAAADAQKATAFVEEVEAATANPSAAATVKGQLNDLMKDFDDGQTPAWAAGALRNATAQMAARGLSASSLAGQALVQAAMESALPIAQADAQTQATFEMQNLSNRQARAMLAAEQRAQFMGMEFDQEFQSRVANAAKISDIANMNFNAEQQIALENARIASTVDLANLDSRKAMALAEAAQIANLETTNLNNRQQASVQNAKSFLEMDMANLNNEQQTAIFKSQQNIQSLLSDQAAENAARQFNATSENQTNQFFANLSSQINQYNATQTNAMAQFNESNAVDVQKFNSQIKEARDQFNAQNQLVVAQSNVQWRRDIATADTVAINAANEFNARAILDMSNQAYDNLWQTYSDVMEYAWTSGENERDRVNRLMHQQLANDGAIDVAKLQANASDNQAAGAFFSRALFGSGGLFGLG